MLGTKYPSAGQILDSHGGVGPGFDFLRLFLSTVILLYHAHGMVTGEQVSKIVLVPLVYMILPVFFALSGFLVTGSAVRTASLKKFLSFRALRIVPALATEVTLSALVIGPLATTLPLNEYFRGKDFYLYFGNIVGKVHLYLPGVFVAEGETKGIVNINLWTLAPEFYCYAIMAALIIFGLVKNRPVLILAVAMTIGALFLSVSGLYESYNGHFRWHLLVYCFVLGTLAYLYRYSIRVSAVYALISGGIGFAIIQFGGSEITPLSVPFLVYVMVFLGMSKMPPIGFFSKGDYSYGIYLYGFPISASLVHFAPWTRNEVLLPALALLLTIVFAVSSWHLIEKPALKLRKRLFKTKAEIPLPETRHKISEADKIPAFEKHDLPADRT